MKIRKGTAGLIALVAVLSLMASACGSSSDDASSTTTAKDGAGASTTTAAPDTAGFDKLTGTLNGGGSSFQDTFQQANSTAFDKEVKSAGGDATVTYTKSGSSDGRKALADNTLDFAGSDGPIKDEEKASFGTRTILYFPIVGGPITVAYNLKGVDDLKLNADVIAKIFQAQITTWDDAAIAKLNPDAKLPSTAITVVHRSDGSGTTKNFTTFLKKAAPDVWKLDAGDTVSWPASTQGAEKSTGVTSVIKSTDGAIGYADLADAAKEDLSVAQVANASGDFVAPTPDTASKALAGAKVNDDLTYDPINSSAAGAYPITSPTWMLVDQVQPDANQAALVQAYLNYLLTTGQASATNLLYAPLPPDLAKKAIAQIDDITVG